jgi:hypothetical protein
MLAAIPQAAMVLTRALKSCPTAVVRTDVRLMLKPSSLPPAEDSEA